MERRQASAPASGGRRKPLFRWCAPHAACARVMKHCVCRRSASFFAGSELLEETVRSPGERAKPGCEAKSERSSPDVCTASSGFAPRKRQNSFSAHSRASGKSSLGPRLRGDEQQIGVRCLNVLMEKNPRAKCAAGTTYMRGHRAACMERDCRARVDPPHERGVAATRETVEAIRLTNVLPAGLH